MLNERFLFYITYRLKAWLNISYDVTYTSLLTVEGSRLILSLYQRNFLQRSKAAFSYHTWESRFNNFLLFRTLKYTWKNVRVWMKNYLLGVVKAAIKYAIIPL